MDELQQIQAQIAELQQKAQQIQLAKKQAAIDEVKATIKAYGLTARDLGLDGGKKERKPIGAAPVKYRDSSGNAWSGRGRQPKWVVDFVAAGGKIEQLSV